MKPALDLPEVECFEVTSPNTSTDREFVEISDRVILMRVAITLRPEVTAPSWLEPGVPFVFAAIKAGEALRELHRYETQKGDFHPVTRGKFLCLYGNVLECINDSEGARHRLEHHITIDWHVDRECSRVERSAKISSKIELECTADGAETAKNH